MLMRPIAIGMFLSITCAAVACGSDDPASDDRTRPVSRSPFEGEISGTAFKLASALVQPPIHEIDEYHWLWIRQEAVECAAVNTFDRDRDLEGRAFRDIQVALPDWPLQEGAVYLMGGGEHTEDKRTSGFFVTNGSTVAVPGRLEIVTVSEDTVLFRLRAVGREGRVEGQAEATICR